MNFTQFTDFAISSIFVLLFIFCLSTIIAGEITNYRKNKNIYTRLLSKPITESFNTQSELKQILDAEK